MKLWKLTSKVLSWTAIWDNKQFDPKEINDCGRQPHYLLSSAFTWWNHVDPKPGSSNGPTQISPPGRNFMLLCPVIQQIVLMHWNPVLTQQILKYRSGLVESGFQSYRSLFMYFPLSSLLRVYEDLSELGSSISHGVTNLGSWLYSPLVLHR